MTLVRSIRTSARNRVAAAIVVLLVGVQTVFFHRPEWNQNARLAATAAFVEPGTTYSGTFRIDALRSGTRFQTEDWAESRGGFYSNKAPGVSLLGIAPYFLLYYAERSLGYDPTAASVTAINVFALNLWISVFWNATAARALLRKLPRLGVHSADGAVIVASTYAFATLVLPFGCSEWGHATAAAFIVLGTLDIAERSGARYGLGGFWLGMAALTEYLAAISLALGGLFVLLRADRSTGWWRFALGAAPPVLALLVYHQICFGNPFTPAPSLSNPSFLQPMKLGGLFGIPHPRNIVLMLFGPGRALFWQMPVLLLSAAGAVAWYRSGRRTMLALASSNIVAYTLAVCSMESWQGGLTTSMRYMIVALPFFCLLLPDIRAVRFRGLFLLLFAVSAANMFALAATGTTFFSEHPLAEFAYPNLWRGVVSFNPILTAVGAGGAWLAYATAAVWACGLAWAIGTTLTAARPSDVSVRV